MHSFSIEEKLKKKLEKLYKKDKVAYEAIESKIKEIISCENVTHYKNLRKPLQDLKRVHIKSSFVLVFKYNFQEDTVLFYDYEHHDRVYK